MATPVNPKYPLFLRDINKNKYNNEGNSIVGGYPVVTVENSFNIEAKPNTFYNINNGEDDEINITFADEEFYANIIANKFIFNINSPANISFDKEIKWNNNKEPDLTQIGIYTISIFNSVGCYTFINAKSSIPNNEIWYTSSDGNVVNPYDTNVFGANIVSNTYENGKGVITFDGAVTSIGNHALRDCSTLTSVIIGNSVTSIQEKAFYFCENLISVTIGNNVTSIGESAFQECMSMTSIVIPNRVTNIEESAFDSCINLTSVILPNSINSIGSYAFAICSNLTSITYEGTQEQWNIITKGDDLYTNVPATVIHCTDGDVEI